MAMALALGVGVVGASVPSFAVASAVSSQHRSLDRVLFRSPLAVPLFDSLLGNPRAEPWVAPRTSRRARVEIGLRKSSYDYAGSARLTATISGTGVGMVSFWSGSRALCSVVVTSSHESCAPSSTGLNAGTYPLIARYTHGGSSTVSSRPTTLTVLPSPVIVTVRASATSVATTSLARLSVRCSAETPRGLRVPGAISLRLDSLLLSDNARNVRFSSLSGVDVTPGRHHLVATFAGSADYRRATSSELLTVTTPSLGSGLAPTFGDVTPTAGGFTVPITDYDPEWSWTGEATGSGVVGISVTGLVTVSGVAPDVASTLTITTTRSGFATASATVSGRAEALEARASLESITGVSASVIDDTANGTSFIDQSYASSDRWLQAYVVAATSITLNWHVTGADGQSLAGAPVSLVDNLAGSASKETAWAENALNATPDGVLSGTTDSSGDVSFTLDNSNASTGSPPSDTTTGSGAQTNEGTYPWTRTALRIAGDVISADPSTQVQQITDLVDLIVIPATPSTTNFDVTHGALLWSQSFTGAAGTSLASNVFTPEIGQYTGTATGLPSWNYGTGEIEDNTANASNVSADGNGDLAITSSCTTNCASAGSGNWTSARISTADKVNFEYGQVEARIKLPTGTFNWPAFWMLGKNFFPAQSWPNCGEIDIAEGLQGNSVDQATLHANNPNSTSDWNGGSGVTLTAPLSNISAGFHTYGILWTPSSISFILDGKVWGSDVYNATAGTITQTDGATVSTFTIGGQVWPFDQPFFLIFDDAIPAGTAAPNGSTSTMDVNWIKYYSYDGYGQVSS